MMTKGAKTRKRKLKETSKGAEVTSETDDDDKKKSKTKSVRKVEGTRRTKNGTETRAKKNDKETKTAQVDQIQRWIQNVGAGITGVFEYFWSSRDNTGPYSEVEVTNPNEWETQRDSVVADRTWTL